MCLDALEFERLKIQEETDRRLDEQRRQAEAEEKRKMDLLHKEEELRRKEV